MSDLASDAARRPAAAALAPKRASKRDVDGWVVLDKPIGMTSTHAVSVVKRAFAAKKAGHAGTLDPLATGVLPIALGEATKTVPFVMDGRKSYRFTVRWGVETDTDDAEGRPVTATNTCPERDQVELLLPRFTGTIEQIPPRFSAIKIKGERAYDLARDGEAPELAARTVQIDRLELVAHHADRSILEADCGKGTYVRALARDLGRALGCLGHVAALRRTRVGPFAEEDAVKLGDLEAARDGAGEALAAVLRPVESALSELPSVAISRDSAARLMRGQPVILRGREAPLEGKLYATCGGVLVAVGDVERGELVPHRVFNLGGA